MLLIVHSQVLDIHVVMSNPLNLAQLIGVILYLGMGPIVLWKNTD